MHDVVDECLAVAKADGVLVPGDPHAATRKLVEGMPAQYSSTAQDLARGISVALYNTAFGLIVAIPALIFWRYFRGRVDDYLLTLELAAERFARHLVSLRRG